MNSRWDDATAASLQGLDLLVYASRLIGAETSLVVWGGGNTSIKQTERDHRGREWRGLRPQEYPEEGFPGRPHGRHRGAAPARGHGRRRDGRLSPLRAAGSRRR